MQGFGTLGATMGRVFASRLQVPAVSLSEGFAQWATEPRRAPSAPGDALDTEASAAWSRHMRDVGHLAQAGGLGSMVTFFNAGANSGDGLVRSLTGVLNQWIALDAVGRAGSKSLAGLLLAVGRPGAGSCSRRSPGSGPSLANLSAAPGAACPRAARHRVERAWPRALAAYPGPAACSPPAAALMVLTASPFSFMFGRAGASRLLTTGHHALWSRRVGRPARRAGASAG